jgi:predicted nucleic acid-binding protein
MGNSKQRSEDAERLGLYKLLADLEAEKEAWSKNILLYPLVIGDALILAVSKVREQIHTFESIDAERVALDGQLQLNHELREVAGL